MEKIEIPVCNLQQIGDKILEYKIETIKNLTKSCDSRLQLSRISSSIDELNIALKTTESSSLNTFSLLKETSDSITKTISNHTESSNNILHTGFNKLYQAVSSIPDGSYSLAFTSGALSALVAALVAFLLNYLYWKKISNHNRLSHFAAMSIEHLNDFESYAISYWISSSNNSKNEKMVELEIRIRTQYLILKSSLNELLKKIPPKYSNDKQSISDFINQIFDDATGGAFESSSKKRDKKLALKISRKCLEIKSILIRYNQKM